MAKYVALVSGELTEVTGTAASAGAADAGKIMQLDSNGKLDTTALPTGVGPDTASIVASEALAAGDLVNVHNNAGTANVRKADASNNRPATGFVLAAFASAATATVYFEGRNTGVTSRTPGATQFLGTGGAMTETAPTTATHISQIVGTAITATSMDFESQRKITLA